MTATAAAPPSPLRNGKETGVVTLSLYQVTIPALVRGLTIFAALLRKGETHATAAGQDPQALVAARLAPDMLPLSGQVQRASDTAKFAASRLTGATAPSFPDDETTLADLHARIDKTIAYLGTVTDAQFDGAETRTVTIGSGDSARQLSGTDYALAFVLPNFYFHVTTGYDILRHQGVPVGKRDYLWPAPNPA